MAAFIDDYIWEIPLFPRSGQFFNKYTLADIYYYNSENTERYNNPKQNIQIPGFVICGKTRDKELILKYKDIIIANKMPIIININIEQWVINSPQLDYLRYHLIKEKKDV